MSFPEGLGMFHKGSRDTIAEKANTDDRVECCCDDGITAGAVNRTPQPVDIPIPWV